MGFHYKIIATPVGHLKLVASANGLAAILWEKDDPARVPLGVMKENSDAPVLLQTEKQLREYFDRKRRMFNIPLDFQGTEFQKKVWAALLTIPYGRTKTYSDIAGQIGAPKALRAVGAANGRNPLSIIVPCHRVIGTNGKLTGFAGGMEAKEKLLALESHAATQASLF